MKTKINFPNTLSPWAEKISKEYGLEYAKTISQEWFNGGIISSGCSFQNRRDYIRNNRLYVRGEQDADEYKKLFSLQEGDLSMVNIDWRIQNSVQKFCRVVSNGIRDGHYKIDIRANDRLSLQLKKDEHKNHLRNMRSLPLMKKAKELLNVNLMPDGFIAQDEEELMLYGQLKPKPKVEIAEEIIIDYVKKTNNWVNIEKNKNKDLTDSGICAVRIFTDRHDGVKLQPIDPEYLVHSKVNTNDFNDAFYYGYVDPTTIGEIKRESGLTDDVIRKIAVSYLSLIHI